MLNLSSLTIADIGVAAACAAYIVKATWAIAHKNNNGRGIDTKKKRCIDFTENILCRDKINRLDTATSEQVKLLNSIDGNTGKIASSVENLVEELRNNHHG